MTHLTTIEEIKTAIRPMSKNIDDSRIHIYIDEAENIDIKSQIGDALLIDLRKWKENSASVTADYSILMNGGEYEVSGEKKYLKGLITTLQYYVHAKLIKNNNYSLTRFGFVNKEDQYSQQSDLKERLVSEKDTLSIADSYMRECLIYLRFNRDLFPLFKKGIQKNRLRISTIGE